ncbi:Isochorismatase-like protein [Mycena leptocephala]|nr:Isochorismatase-like protein [Mycena leptocephala]
MDPSTTLFFLCDLQERFRPVIYGFEHIVASTNKILKVAKLLQCEVVVTTQKTKVLGPIDSAVNIDSLGALHIGNYDKTLFSMLTSEVLTFLSSRPAIKSIVLMGIESHICILQTALALLNLPTKYTAYVLADAVSSSNPAEVPLALAQMRAAGVPCLSAIGDASAPDFKAFSNIIKEEKEATAKAVEALLGRGPERSAL